MRFFGSDCLSFLHIVHGDKEGNGLCFQVTATSVSAPDVSEQTTAACAVCACIGIDLEEPYAQ